MQTLGIAHDCLSEHLLSNTSTLHSSDYYTNLMSAQDIMSSSVERYEVGTCTMYSRSNAQVHVLTSSAWTNPGLEYTTFYKHP